MSLKNEQERIDAVVQAMIKMEVSESDAKKILEYSFED